jgi:predicted DNA binding protein
MGRLMYIKRKEVSDFFLVNVMPKMTSKQRKAIELAIKNGYYDYQRKVTLKTLSRIMRLSYATYQAHLRKAEQKLIPFLSKGDDVK